MRDVNDSENPGHGQHRLAMLIDRIEVFRTWCHRRTFFEDRYGSEIPDPNTHRQSTGIVFIVLSASYYKQWGEDKIKIKINNKLYERGFDAKRKSYELDFLVG